MSGIDALGMQVLAANVHVGLDLLLQLVDTQHHCDVDHVIEMTGCPRQLGHDVGADRRGDFQVVAGDGQIHGISLRVAWVTIAPAPATAPCAG
jgi:hypothetical protein